MTGPLPPCAVCGAPRAADAPMYCTFCGAKQATGIADPVAYRTIPERYELVTKQPGFAVAQGHRPRLPAASHILTAVGFVIVSTGIAAAFVAVARLGDAPPVFAFFGYGLGTVVAILGLLQVGRAVVRVAAPTRAEVAVITSERADDWADDGAGHQLELRGRDGTVRRFGASGEMVGSIVPGDIGLAYVQHDRLLEFRWFDVMPAPRPAGEPARPPSCTTCAAPLTFASKTTCLHCGAPLADLELGEHGHAFAAVAARPATQAALGRKVVGGLPGFTGPVIVLGIGAALAYFLWELRFAVIFFTLEGSPYVPLILVPAVVLLAVGAIWLRRRMLPHLARPVALVAMVLRRRDVLVATVNRRPVYHHYLTVAAANGARRELRALADVPALVRDGELGVAHVRGDWLVAFERTNS